MSRLNKIEIKRDYEACVKSKILQMCKKGIGLWKINVTQRIGATQSLGLVDYRITNRINIQIVFIIYETKSIRTYHC